MSASTAKTHDSRPPARIPRAGGAPRDNQTVVVVIPALNEAATIGEVVAAVPRSIPNVARVQVIVVDDGSTDATRAVALAAGVDRVERHTGNRGLVAAFRTGIAAALDAGADVVVHLDGDGQHDPAYIPALVAPVVDGDADVVVGVRPLAHAKTGSLVRRQGNRLASWLLRRVLKMPVTDVTSGYRAFSRASLMRLNVVSEYTYTLETLIRAARMKLTLREVVVPARARAYGTSRMTRSVTRYIGHTGGQALRTILHSNPLTMFGRAAVMCLLLSGILSTWFLLAYQDGGLHLPVLLASVFAFVLSVGLFIAGLIADGVNTNHRLLEDALTRLKRIEHDLVAARVDVADEATAAATTQRT